jgi:hypothetical protein
LRSRRRGDGNERGGGGLLIPLEKRGKGGVRILFLGYKERGDFPVTGYGKSGSERMDEEEGGGATTQGNLWNPGRELCI